MLGKIIINKTTFPALNKALDAGMMRNRVIANNIANVNTPGYRRVEVSFESELKTALDRTKLQGTQTDAKHMGMGRKNLSDVNARSYRPNDPSLASGVNNVDIDMEMAKLAETQIMYNYAIRFGKGVFNKLNAAIQAKTLPQ